jgi:hypothetical protein
MNNLTTHSMPQDLLQGRAERISQGRGGDDPGQKPSEQFETVFLYKVVEAMRSTVPDSGLLTSKAGSQMHDHLIAQALSDTMAQGGGIGISQYFQELDGAMEVSPSGLPESPQLQRNLAGGNTFATVDALALSGENMEAFETPLSETLPPSTDPWLDDFDAESTLQKILTGGGHE